MPDDLATGLRAVAESGQSAPSVPGTEIRRRAGARRRRRRTVAVVAGASAAAALGATLLHGLTGSDAEHRSSAAAGTPTGTPRAPLATVDLARRVLTVDGRRLPVSAGKSGHPTPTGRMTVTALKASRALVGEAVGLEGPYTVTVPWVVELRGKDGRSTFLGAMYYNTAAIGRYDATSGWIALGPKDAKRLYGRLRVGDVVDVVGGGRTAKPPPGAGGGSGSG
ncbi:L,D-transpeptidase [Streptomyces sp. NPDC096012]|uniref:L,D-transpeptidase n=1 Tax=Streptomyces sp. NPDC096012 TaxID=3155684 RepID=UPI00336A7FF6